LPYAPVGPYWFLYALVMLHGFATLLNLLGLRRIVPLALVALSAGSMIAGMSGIIEQTCLMAPWYGAGYWLGARGDRLAGVAETAPREGALVAAGFVGLLLISGPQNLAGWPGIAAQGAAPIASFVWGKVFYPLAFAGICAVICTALLLPMGRFSVARYLGQRTMAIYVVHVLFVAGLRILCHRLHLSSPYLLLALLALAGLCGPLALFEIACRLKVNRWLGLGRSVTVP
jgi:fucose 4-O-acetylase-like acetyltransferase